MLVAGLIPVPLERVEFSYSEVHNVPDATGCYVLASFNGVVLYVGQGRLAQRLGVHLSDREKRARTQHGVVYWFYYTECSERDMNLLEGGWVNQHKNSEGVRPFLNKIDPPA